MGGASALSVLCVGMPLLMLLRVRVGVGACTRVRVCVCVHVGAWTRVHGRVCVYVCACMCVCPRRSNAETLRKHGSRKGWNWCQYNALATQSTRRAKQHRAAAAWSRSPRPWRQQGNSRSGVWQGHRMREASKGRGPSSQNHRLVPLRRARADGRGNARRGRGGDRTHTRTG